MSGELGSTSPFLQLLHLRLRTFFVRNLKGHNGVLNLWMNTTIVSHFQAAFRKQQHHYSSNLSLSI